MEELFNIAIEENMESQFAQIANKLMNEYDLVVDNVKFQLLDIEFYLKNNVHNDKYVHGNERQKKAYEWYLHRKSEDANGAINKGTRKGLDFTFGNVTTYGGILIRAIRNKEDLSLSEGPSLTVDRIKNILEVEDVEELSKLIEGKNHKETKIYFEKKEKPSHYFIYFGKRHGLTSKTDPQYYDKNYRFVVIDSNTNGIKDKTALLKNALSVRSLEDIRKDVGYNINLD